SKLFEKTFVLNDFAKKRSEGRVTNPRLPGWLEPLGSLEASGPLRDDVTSSHFSAARHWSGRSKPVRSSKSGMDACISSQDYGRDVPNPWDGVTEAKSGPDAGNDVGQRAWQQHFDEHRVAPGAK